MVSANSGYVQPETGISIWQGRLEGYRTWLVKQNISSHTKRAYCSQVRQFIEFMIDSPSIADRCLEDNTVFETVVREYREFLKNILTASSSSINNSLVAIDNFCRFLGIKTLRVERERRTNRVPKILSSDKKEMFLGAVKRQSSIRDRALALVLFYSGIRISECAALNVNDVIIDDQSAHLIVRHQDMLTDAQCKEIIVPNAAAVRALQTWLIERSKLAAELAESALWISERKKRLSISSIDYIIRHIGWEAQLVLSAEILRQTFVANRKRETLTRHSGSGLNLGTVLGHVFYQ